MLLLLAGTVELARVFYTYHTLHKALSGGAALLARSANVNYCDPADPALVSATNFIVYGNLQGVGTPIAQGLADFIQILPERQASDSTSVTECMCMQDDADSCDASGTGRSPDFVVVNLGSGYPLQLPFAYLNIGTVNLRVSVRMPVTGS